MKLTPEYLAQRLVDDVSLITQLNPDKGQLANVDDWRRCAERLFRLQLAQARSDWDKERAREAGSVNRRR